MTMEYEIRYDLLQPWSTFVMKTELPPDILEKMLRISDEIIENNDLIDFTTATKVVVNTIATSSLNNINGNLDLQSKATYYLRIEE